MRVLTWAAAGLLALGPAVAQLPPRAADPVLAPPSLPSALPGGLAIPGLQGGSASEALQRILDAAGGRAPAVPPPSFMMPAPTVPTQSNPMTAQPAARVDPADPLSGSEAFFAARLPDAPPLRQFGYDTFRVQWAISR